MNHVDATSAASAAPAPPSAWTAVEPADLAGPTPDFASALLAASSSSPDPSGLLQLRAADVCGTAQRYLRISEALSSTGRQNVFRQTTGAQADDKPDHVDRFETARRERGADGSAPKESAADRASEPRSDRRRERAHSAGMDGAQPEQTTDGLSERAAAEGPSVGEDGSQPRPEATGTPTPSVSAEPAETKGTPASVAPGSSGQAAAPVSVSASASPSSPEAPLGPAAVSIAVPIQPSNPVGSQPGSSGLAQDALNSSAGQAAEATGRPNGTSTAEFQSLLAQAARGRSVLQKPGSTPAAEASPGDESPTVNLARTGAVKEMAQLLRSNVGPKHSTMVLRLDPPELGKLQVDLQMHNQVLTVRFQAETEAGHRILQQRLLELRSALEQHGIQLDRVEVELRQPATPADTARDAHGQPQHEPQPQDSSAYTQGDPHGPGDHSSGPANEPSATEGVGVTSVSFETSPTDESVRPAETGVDLIV